MPAMTLLNVLDSIAYLRAYAPDRFPEEDHVTLDSVYEDILPHVEHAMRGARKAHVRQAYDLALGELRASKEMYERGDEDEALKLVDMSDYHLRQALTGQRVVADYIVSASGVSAKTDDPGPETPN